MNRIRMESARVRGLNKDGRGVFYSLKDLCVLQRNFCAVERFFGYFVSLLNWILNRESKAKLNAFTL